MVPASSIPTSPSPAHRCHIQIIQGLHASPLLVHDPTVMLRFFQGYPSNERLMEQSLAGNFNCSTAREAAVVH